MSRAEKKSSPPRTPEAIFQPDDKDRSGRTSYRARGSGRAPPPRAAGERRTTAVPPARDRPRELGEGWKPFSLASSEVGRSVSPAKREPAEEVNVAPASSLHGCSGGRGQGMLQVQALPSGQHQELPRRPLDPAVPSLLSLSPTSAPPGLPDPGSQPPGKKQRFTPPRLPTKPPTLTCSSPSRCVLT